MQAWGNKWYQDEGLIGITKRRYTHTEMGYTYLIIRFNYMRARDDNSGLRRHYKAPCTDTTRCLYRHYKVLVRRLQDACSATTKGL